MSQGGGRRLHAAPSSSRRSGGEAAIPAVAITAYSDDATEDACTKAGALAVLPTPVEMGRLLEVVSSAFRSSNA